MMSLYVLPLILAAQANPIQVPIVLTEDAIVVNANVNGREVSLMFDTGFSGGVLLDASVDVGKPTGEITLRDFVGEFKAPTVRLKSLTIGSFKGNVDGLEIVQQRGSDYTDAYGVHCDGILGLAAFRNSIMGINFEKGMFEFYPPNFQVTSLAPDSKKRFLTSLLPTGYGSLEMLVTANTGKQMVLALDTGNAFFATTHSDVLERIGLRKQSDPVKYMGYSGVASGTVESYKFGMKDCNIFGVNVPNSVWSIINLPSSSAEHDGTVGYQFLRNFNVIFDMQRRRVFLDNFKGEIKQAGSASIGLAAAYSRSQKSVIAVNVTPESPAARAGLRQGDSIIEVDGKELGRYGFKKMDRLLRGEPGEAVKLVYLSGGLTKRIVLKRELLIN